MQLLHRRPPDRRQLRIPNVPKSDGRTPVTRQFVQLLETALGKELRRPRKRNDPSRRVSRGTSFAELTADDKSDDQGERSSLTLVEAIRTDLSDLPFLFPSSVLSAWCDSGVFLSSLLVDLATPAVPRHFGDHSPRLSSDQPAGSRPSSRRCYLPVDTRR